MMIALDGTPGGVMVGGGGLRDGEGCIIGDEGMERNRSAKFRVR